MRLRARTPLFVACRAGRARFRLASQPKAAGQNARFARGVTGRACFLENGSVRFDTPAAPAAKRPGPCEE
jgi:hypothetical protein